MFPDSSCGVAGTAEGSEKRTSCFVIFPPFNNVWVCVETDQLSVLKETLGCVLRRNHFGDVIVSMISMKPTGCELFSIVGRLEDPSCVHRIRIDFVDGIQLMGVCRLPLANIFQNG